MHILEIPSFFTPYGGEFCLEQAKALQAQGNEVRILSNVQLSIKKSIKEYLYLPCSRFTENIDGIRAYRSYQHSFPHVIKPNVMRWISIVQSMFKDYVKQYGKPDILHAHCCKWAGYAAMLISNEYGIPYVTELSELEFLQQTSNQANAPLGQLTTLYIQEISTISQNGAKYRYKDSVNWFSAPSEHYFDVMGIGFINSVKIDSSVYFNYVYETPTTGYTTSTLYYDKKSTASGGSTVYKIPNNIVMLSSNIYFDVIKNTTDTLTYLEFCGDYAHALSSVTASQAADHGIGSLGIDHGVSVYNYYNHIPCCDAGVTVNW